MNKLAIGILAHVDAGKTTLSEGLMYLTGQLRRLGRVDHGDAFLDTFALERSRGITIFSKQAVFTVGDKEFTLLDTPGHVDFSAEMERTLSVLDYAILVISGPDGVQGHTETLWRLLREYRIPTFIFVNKMDQDGTDRVLILEKLKNYLGEGCIPFDLDPASEKYSEDFLEAVAMCDEAVLDRYLEEGEISGEEIAGLIARRKVYPCYFGSALKLDGVEDFLTGLDRYTRVPSYGKDFAARVYKITRDDQGNRLTHLKVTGGSLRVKMPLDDDKIDQIRIYSGTKYTMTDQADAGTVCAVTGLSSTAAGQGLGAETGETPSLLTPVLSCQMILPEGTDVVKALRRLRELEEEEPELHIMWNPTLQEIQVQLMGEVQTEVLADMIEERYHMRVTFGEEHIMYRETIRGSVSGVGHYEPLRHYAEVHLRLSEGEQGSGLVFDSECGEDDLDRNWQRLILTHLYEKDHLGVLTGSPITDMRITLTAGRAHLKHTEGGDFRQSTYRAVRQGLMNALYGGQAVLLEPWYDFRLELPADQLGRGMADIQKMSGHFDDPLIDMDRAVLTGKAPASEMKDYQKEVWSYSGGRGRLTLKLAGYEPCHNAEEVIAARGYDPEADLDNPSGSIFCAHGAGFFVPWHEVPEYMHIREASQGDEWDDDAHSDDASYGPNGLVRSSHDESNVSMNSSYDETNVPMNSSYDRKVEHDNHRYRDISYAEEKELMEIFEREFGKKERKKPGYQTSGKGSGFYSGNGRNPSGYSGSSTRDFSRTSGDAGGSARDHISSPRRFRKEKEYLLVDGYNIIFAWEELKGLAGDSLDAARSKLTDILCNYQGYVGCEVILVFDAYKVKGNHREVYKHNNIHIVYTKEAETADQYIEKTTHELGRKHKVRVATSDSLEQVIVMGQGAERVSARDFFKEVELVNEAIREINREKKAHGKNYLFDHMDEEMAEEMEQVRLGEKAFGENTENIERNQT